jgi:hypothetical protein
MDPHGDEWEVDTGEKHSDKPHLSRTHLLGIIRSLWENHDPFPGADNAEHLPEMPPAFKWALPVQWDAAQGLKKPSAQGIVEQLDLCDIVEGPRGGQAEEGNILPALMLGKKHECLTTGEVRIPFPLQGKKGGKRDAREGLCGPKNPLPYFAGIGSPPPSGFIHPLIPTIPVRTHTDIVPRGQKK